MPIISLRISSQQQTELELLAAQHQQTVSNYVMCTLFPNYSPSPNALSHKEILQRITPFLSGKEFSISDLFTDKEWGNFDNTISIGRTFRIAEKNKTSIVAQSVEFVKKDSGKAAVYRKK